MWPKLTAGAVAISIRNVSAVDTVRLEVMMRWESKHCATHEGTEIRHAGSQSLMTTEPPRLDVTSPPSASGNDVTRVRRKSFEYIIAKICQH